MGGGRNALLARLPLRAIVPAAVALLGLLAGLGTAILGVVELRRASDDAAGLHAAALAETLAARLRAIGSENRADVVLRAGSRSGADVLLVDAYGRVLVDASFGAPDPASILDCLVAGAGELDTALGRTRYAARPLGAPFETLAVIAFVPAQATPPEVRPFVQSAATLTALLVGIASAVAWVFAQGVQDDVEWVRRRIDRMARSDAGSPIAAIPVRALDDVGALTAAFDVLAERFAVAERTYLRDLATAEASVRERTAFLAALSHELRTPLHAILGFADVLLSEVDGPLDDDQRENLDVVRASAAHLAALIDDVLDLSALESGELRLERSATDVARIAAEVVREAAPGAAAKALALSLAIDGEARADADPRRVRQVVGNLVGNAVKFTPRGSVDVRVERRGPYVAVVTEDTGPGVPEAARAMIFEAFRQAGDASARRAGSGLGLSIARRIVEMHGGRIEVGTGSRGGARFTATFPAWMGDGA